jgi:hypothetical protein
MIYVRWKTNRFEEGIEIFTGTEWKSWDRVSLQEFLSAGGSVHMNPKYVNGVLQ